MATEEDLKKAEAEEEAEEAAEAPEAPLAVSSPSTALAKSEEASVTPEDKAEGEAELEDDVPVQLGYQRYVYAAYMAAAMLVGFLVAKSGHAGWYKLGQWKPELGEPKDEYLYPVAGLIGVFVAIYYWRKPSSRQYANEVAEELSKVTWPSRKETTITTSMVFVMVAVASVFFLAVDAVLGWGITAVLGLGS